MSDLQKGWIIKSIDSVFEIVKDKGQEGVIPYLEIGNIDIQLKKYALTDKPSVKGCKKAIKGDVLVSKVRPTRGAITQVEESELNVSSAFTILRNSKISDKYLWLFLGWNKEFLDYLGNNCTGTMYPTTSDEVISSFKIPLAPLNEQKRIVEKLEKLLGKVEAVQARLNKIPAILKRFRQAILAAACSGKLTADWRENKEINLESDLPFDLPKAWKSENLGQLCEIKGGIQKTPHRKPINNKYPYLRVANVYRNELRLNEITYFELFEGELERWKLQKVLHIILYKATSLVSEKV